MASGTGMALATSTPYSPPSSTSTVLPTLAFTTPFAQPPSCSSLPFTTTVSYFYEGGNASSSTTFLFPETSDPSYTSCLAPAGPQFSFSPAVCPQGWPAWWLGTIIAPASLGTVLGNKFYISTAYCCAPGYTKEHPNIARTHIASPSCSKSFSNRTDSGIAVLPAWHISWYTTDVPTMTPQPPALEGGEQITRWLPGSEPEREKKVDRPTTDGPKNDDPNSYLFRFLVYGVPILVVAFFAACLCGPCCYYAMRKEPPESKDNNVGNFSLQARTSRR